MEKASDRRRRKLDSLCEKHGQKTVADRAELNPQYLTQILNGTRLPPKAGEKEGAPRSLGNAAARKIEDAFDLGVGWFDNDDSVGLSREAILLGQLYDEVPAGAAKAKWYAKRRAELEKLAVAAHLPRKAEAPARSESPKRALARR